MRAGLDPGGLGGWPKHCSLRLPTGNQPLFDIPIHAALVSLPPTGEKGLLGCRSFGPHTLCGGARACRPLRQILAGAPRGGSSLAFSPSGFARHPVSRPDQSGGCAFDPSQNIGFRMERRASRSPIGFPGSRHHRSSIFRPRCAATHAGGRAGSGFSRLHDSHRGTPSGILRLAGK